MPDWTYLPVRPLATRVLGEARAVRLALASAAALAAAPGGRALITAVGGTRPPAGATRTVDGLTLRSPVVVRIGPAHVEHALRVLPLLGAGLIEVTAPLPDGLHPVVPVLSLAQAPPVDAVDVAGPDEAVAAVRAGARLVRVHGGQLAADGPGLIARITEAIVALSPVPSPALSLDPRRWPAWMWALLNGVGLICGGIGAAVITLGPVLLWYDQAFLGANVASLSRLSPHLIGFIRHDRITLAGSMVATGTVYVGFALGMRAGWDWARLGLLASGLVGFPTLAYFLAWGFFEPLHTLLTAILLPMWYVAIRRPVPPSFRAAPDGPESVRRRALYGQLFLVALGSGLVLGGAVVSFVGLTGVFVPSDLVFLGASAHHLDVANARLLAFIAHDRAGFGGVLMAAGVAIAWLAARGWRRGAAGTWWTLAIAAAFGWLPAIAIHVSVGYLDLLHLLPVYAGIALTAVALALARPYLCSSTVEDIRPLTYAGVPRRSHDT